MYINNNYSENDDFNNNNDDDDNSRDSFVNMVIVNVIKLNSNIDKKYENLLTGG